MTSEKVQALGDKLLQRGRSPAPGSVSVLPVSEMPMVLTLDQLRPNPDNPRTTRNPKYDEIKVSIQARGLGSVPMVTKNPDSEDDVYIFSDGGNTRYTILVELWEETRDERFRRIHCIFKPWPGRLKCVIGHLAENDVRGDLLFIEKALGIAKAKSIYEEQIGKIISQRELESFLRLEGYPVSQSSISRMEYTLEHLYPHMPGLFNSGLGRPQVAQLITLRNAAQKAWDTFSANFPVLNSFSEIFSEVCRTLDNPENYALEAFKDELIAALLRAMPSTEITYDRWLIELDPQELNRRKLFGEPAPLPQHIINADKEPVLNEAVLAPVIGISASDGIDSSDDLRLNGAPPTTALQPDAGSTLSGAKRSAPANTGSVSQQGGAIRNEEEQIDLFGQLHEPQELTPPVIFPLASGAVQPEQHHDEALPVPDSVATDSSISFANTGLEPVADIWLISALQDDPEHLQGAAFRLAFELAEVSGAELELCEENGPDSAGYRLQAMVHQASPVTRLLAAMAGTAASSLSGAELTNIVFGTEQPADTPLLDDIQLVKLLRLIRLIRRLREIQRQSQQHQNDVHGEQGSSLFHMEVSSE